MNPLVLSQIGFSYNGSAVVDGVSLEIAAGELVSLIGPNGAGKSTLIKIAMGLLKPAMGRVLLFGREYKAWKLKDLARKLAYLPQNALLPPAFTVWETVLLGRTPFLGFLGVPDEEDQEAALDALKRVDASHLTERRICAISGGERQRVLLARALAQQPSLLLLDEPTASLDMHHQVTIFNIIHDLAARGKMAVLTVLHDLNLASAFSDRQILMVDGKIRAEGSPPEVLNQECITALYGEHIRIVPDLLNGGRPAVLPSPGRKPHG